MTHYYGTLSYQHLEASIHRFAGKFALGTDTAATRNCFAGLRQEVDRRAGLFTEIGATVDYRPLARLATRTASLVTP